MDSDVARTVNETGPSVVGVPEISPVDAFSVRQSGSDPTVTEYVTPPVTVPAVNRVTEYGVPTSASGSGLSLAMPKTVRAHCLVMALPKLSVALTPKV